MKKIMPKIYPLFLLVAFLIVLSGCEKDDHTTGSSAGEGLGIRKLPSTVDIYISLNVKDRKTKTGEYYIMPYVSNMSPFKIHKVSVYIASDNKPALTLGSWMFIDAKTSQACEDETDISEYINPRLVLNYKFNTTNFMQVYHRSENGYFRRESN